MTQLLRKWLVEEVGSPDAGPSLEQVSHDGPVMAYRCLRIDAEHRKSQLLHAALCQWLLAGGDAQQT